MSAVTSASHVMQHSIESYEFRQTITWVFADKPLLKQIHNGYCELWKYLGETVTTDVRWTVWLIFVN